MHSHKLDDRYRCTGCDKVLDGATNTGQAAAPPKPGDFSVCAYCAAILRFEAGALREATASDLDELEPEQLRTIAAAQLGIAAARARGGFAT